MLLIKGLAKTYAGGIQALRGIDLQAPSGMFGLLGPNGSGKTTLMKILATLLEPDAGTIEMNGVNLLSRKAEVRRTLGYLPQEFGLYPTLTAEQTLDYLAKLKGVWNAAERQKLVGALLEGVNLSAEKAQRVGGFSGGMLQRLGIAQALIGEPKLIIVDEPTAGLDPEERVRFHNLLSETVREGTVVILSTHIVSDVANLCTHMAVIRRGRILAACEPHRALEELKDLMWEGSVPSDSVPELKSRYKVISSQMFKGQPRLRVVSNGERPRGEFTKVNPTLEDYYLNLVTQPSGEVSSASR